MSTLVIGRTMEDAEAKIAAQLGGKRSDMPAEMQAQLRSLYIVGDAPAVQEQVQTMLDSGLDGIVFKSGQTPDTPGS